MIGNTARTTVLAAGKRAARRLRSHIDTAAASLAFGVGLIVAVVGASARASSLLILIAIPLCAGGFIHIARGKSIAVEPRTTQRSVPHSSLAGSTLTILTLSAAQIVFHTTVFRPDAYFLLMGVSAAGILVQAHTNLSGRQLLWVLAQGLILATFLQAHALFESPALTISDIEGHKAAILAWEQAGHLFRWYPASETWFGYYDWPMMHLSVITTLLMTGLSFKPALFIAVGLPFVAALLFVYLLAARLLSHSAGVLALVFAAAATPHIYWGAVLIPTTMGVTFFCALVYSAVFWRHSTTHTLLFLLLGVGLIYTHTASSFITMIATFAVVVVGAVSNRSTPKAYRPAIPLACLLLLAIGSIGKWLYAFHLPGLTFFELVTASLLQSVVEVAAPTPNIVYSANQNPLDSLWLSVAALMFVVGALACLHPTVRSWRRFAGLAAVAVLCLATVAFPLLGLRNILPHRWLPFIFSGGAWLAVLGVVWGNSVSGTLRSHAIRVASIATFAGLSLFSTTVHPHTPLSPTPNALSWTASEASAGQTIAGWSPQTITVDTYYKGLADGLSAGHSVNQQPLSTEVAPRGLVILRHAVRDTMNEGPTGTWQAGQQGSNPNETRLFATLEDHPYLQVYESHSVSAYLSLAQSD